MKLNITTIQNGKEQKLSFKYKLIPKDEGLDGYFSPEINITEPLSVTVDVENCGEYIGIFADVHIKYEIPCSRCLTPVTAEGDATIERYAAPSRRFEAYDDESFSEDDLSEVREGEICIDSDICEELSLSLPGYALCTQDCPGLCPKCGKKLAEGECSCPKEKKIDERLKIFEKLLQND